MIAGYILTGGKNRRMNGEKKLLLEYHGETFFTRICDALRMFPTIYLSVDETAPFEKLQKPMISDVYSDIGPMGGIFSGLLSCEEEALFVIACDMPFADHESVEALYEEYQKAPGRITVAKSGERIHPLFGVYPREALPLMEQMIENGEYRMMDLLGRAGFSAVPIDPKKHVLDNINSTEEYRMLTRKPFFFAISGYKHTGKTTMITRLIPELTRMGLKVAVIKHDGHDFESDVPGTDSWKHQKAGAYGTAVFSKNRVMITKECEGLDEVQIAQAFPEADVILIEGLKNSDYPKYICNYPNEELEDAAMLAQRIVNLLEA
jgi:molybdopterin-guanine dinucleotide biosynthesis protein MobB